MNNSTLSLKTFKTYSLGCRANQAEIEIISKQLIDRGLRQSQPGEKPDLILFNTCSVTQKAEKETRQIMRQIKKAYPSAKLVVLGCTVTAREKYKTPLPAADLFIANEDKHRTLSLLEHKFGTLGIAKNISRLENMYLASGRKFILIQTGCHNFCSFCLTAFLRGEPTSIPPQSIIEEINAWLPLNIKEVILTGTNLALWGEDLEPAQTITDLLSAILNQTKAERLSLSSIYPEMLTPDFLNLVSQNSRISRYFHLSLQSGSPTVLQRMNRPTNLEKLKQVLAKLKKEIPDFTFRADFIVGFPEETEEEFAETLRFVKENKIAFAHIFPFSKRKGTVAFEMIEKKSWKDLPFQIKKERVKKLRETVKEIREIEARQLINKISDCLIIRNNEAITHNGWPIWINNTKPKIKSLKGKITPVKITAFENDQLLGEIISLPT